MKQWYTKTGVQLKVINGGGESTPRRDFRSIPEPELNEYDLQLLSAFKRATIFIVKSQAYGSWNEFELHVNLRMSSELFPQSLGMRHKFKGNLALDTSNYLCQFHGLNRYLVPTIDSTQRSSKGIKTISIVYRIDIDTAISLGMSEKSAKSYNPYFSLKQA